MNNEFNLLTEKEQSFVQRLIDAINARGVAIGDAVPRISKSKADLSTLKGLVKQGVLYTNGNSEQGFTAEAIARFGLGGQSEVIPVPAPYSEEQAAADVADITADSNPGPAKKGKKAPKAPAKQDSDVKVFKFTVETDKGTFKYERKSKTVLSALSTLVGVLRKEHGQDVTVKSIKFA
jgi:hypothetical protein